MHIFLETGRLTLRRFTENDVDNLFDLNSDPVVMRYITGGRSTQGEVEYELTRAQWETRAGSDTCPAH